MVVIIPTIIEWVGKISGFLTLEAEIRQCVHSVSGYRLTRELEKLYADIDFSYLDEEWAIYADKADCYIAKKKAQITGQNLFSEQEKMEFIESFFDKNGDVLPYRNYVEPILKKFINRLEELLLKLISPGEKVIIQKMNRQQSDIAKISLQIGALNSLEQKLNENQIIPSPKNDTSIENNNDISNNTEKIFQKKYHKKLFLEDDSAPIYLHDVYVEPRLIEKNLNQKGQKRVPITANSMDVATPINDFAINYIFSFIKKSTVDRVLFIEGVAGVGKSTLLSKLSTIFYGKDIFYKSLKEYLYIDHIQLKRELLGTFFLNDNDCGKIFLLDGLDEIWNRIDPDIFRDDLKFFLERNYKIVITLRPGYVQYNEYVNECKLCTLEIFGVHEKMEWLNNYKKKKTSLSDITIKNILENAKFAQITSIPIMLYIIANRNIDISSAASMPALYDQVFNSLKEDKGSNTQKRLENDYLNAQRIAYIMQAKDILSINKSDLLNLLPVNDSFYSSVYMDKFIDGDEILQFVHRSIQEFFAAKWIFNQASSNDYTTWTLVFGEHIFSRELLSNLRFFYNFVTCNVDEMCNRFICEGYPFLIQGNCTWEEYTQYIKNILVNTYNFHNVITHSDMEVIGCQEMGTFFEVTDYTKWAGNSKEMRAIKFSNCLFKNIIIRNYNFYNLVLNNCRFISCVFENTSFFQCSFVFCDSATDVIFRRCQFNNIRFYANKNQIQFEDCTFVLYDSKTARETAAEIRKCKLDEKSSNDLKKTVDYYAD